MRNDGAASAATPSVAREGEDDRRQRLARNRFGAFPSEQHRRHDDADDADAEQHGQRAGDREQSVAADDHARVRVNEIGRRAGGARSASRRPAGPRTASPSPRGTSAGKNSRLEIAGAVLMSRAVLPMSRPIGTSAHAPQRNTPGERQPRAGQLQPEDGPGEQHQDHQREESGQDAP